MNVKKASKHTLIDHIFELYKDDDKLKALITGSYIDSDGDEITYGTLDEFTQEKFTNQLNYDLGIILDTLNGLYEYEE
jgi:hypothetical protein